VPNLAPYFTLEEYAARLAKTRKAMEQKGIDTLVVVDPANMYWLTGYDGWSFYVPQAVVVRGDELPFWFGRKSDGQGARVTTYLPDDHVLWYEENYIQTTERHPFDRLAEIFIERGWGSSTVGLEMDASYFTINAYKALETHLPNAKLKNSFELVNWQRAIKSRQELDYMRTAGRIIERVYDRISEVIRPGVRQCDVIAEIFSTGARGLPDAGGDYAAVVPLVGAGSDLAAPHLTWSDKPFLADEAVMFELAGAHRHYHAPLSRTFYLGKPQDKFLDAASAVVEGIDAALAKAKPGNFCEDIAIALYDAVEKRGYRKESRTGYSIGIGYPPDWGEHSMSLRRGEKIELQPGMAFHFMPALWMGDWGMVITESLVITETGCETLTNYPRRLLEIS
jgi:ectoine hydrolase